MTEQGRFRLNVGVLLTNSDKQVLLGKRVKKEAWQLPQGGIQEGETPEEAMFRELEEEIGLTAADVTILGRTQQWHTYSTPPLMRRMDSLYIGQRQLWFLLRLNEQAEPIRLDASKLPEFDAWRWVTYWYPLRAVISFKKEVYRKMLCELSPTLFGRKLVERELPCELLTPF